MTGPGQPTYTYAPVPAGPQQPEHTIPLWVIWVAVGLLLAGIGMVAFALLAEQRSSDRTPDYPSSWDPRVLPYVRAAEKQRDLQFLHPVAVRFLTGPEFEKGVRTDEADLDKNDRAQIEQTAGLFRALGLMSGDVDLFAAFNDATGGGTLAYYSFEDQRITVRGTRLTLAAHATLVHELTHALQDQHFGIGARYRELAKAQTHDAEIDVLQAAVEGDAERTAQLYRDSLPRRQRARLVAAEAAFEKSVSGKIPNVPPVVTAIIGAPYALGQTMVDTVAQQGTEHAIDKLFSDTPTHDAALLDPFEVVAGETGARAVPQPELGHGEKKIDRSEFGALTWYLMLAERLPLRDALAAADGWGGDASVSFVRDQRSCTRMTYVGDTDADTRTMDAALVRWQQAVPGYPAKVALADGRITFETCDPGTKAKAGKGQAEQAIGLAANRSFLTLSLVKSGAPVKAARCLSTQMIDTFSLAELSRPTFGRDAATRSTVARLAAGCR